MSRSSEQIPRNGRKLVVLGIARISSEGQDEKSLADQKQLLKRWLSQQGISNYKLYMISTRGSGERLDRAELKLLRKRIRSNKVDLVLAEDIGRICRRVEAFKICEMCEDHNTRLVAINDHIDTADESWRFLSFFAAVRHEQHNEDTSRRIKRSHRSRFLQGGIVQTFIFCYDKPPGAKNLSEIKKIPEFEAVILGIFERLEQDWSYSEVADWLNEQQVSTGHWCRNSKWDSAMVSRVVHCPMLKGVRIRNKKVTRRNNKTGRRKPVNAPPEEWIEILCPHLAFVSAERYDRLIAKLTAKNACFRAGKKTGVDPRLGRPKKRTIWPGQHVICGICGRNLVYGGNGQNRHLACRGSKEYKCWNAISFNADKFAPKIAQAVIDEIAKMPEFDDVYSAYVREELSRRKDSRVERAATVRNALVACERKRDNIAQSIADTGGSQVLHEHLKKLESEHSELAIKLQDIEQEPQVVASLPSLAELRQMAIDSFTKLSYESHEFAKLMKRLIHTIVVYPHRALDPGHIVLRARFRLL